MDTKGNVIRELADSKVLAYDSYKMPKTELSYYQTRDGLELPMTVILPLTLIRQKSIRYGFQFTVGRMQEGFSINGAVHWVKPTGGLRKVLYR
jgi:hypothetical protein